MPVSRKPTKRQQILTLTGQPLVPVFVEDDGQTTFTSQAIIDHAVGASKRS